MIIEFKQLISRAMLLRCFRLNWATLLHTKPTERGYTIARCTSLFLVISIDSEKASSVSPWQKVIIDLHVPSLKLINNSIDIFTAARLIQYSGLSRDGHGRMQAAESAASTAAMIFDQVHKVPVYPARVIC